MEDIHETLEPINDVQYPETVPMRRQTSYVGHLSNAVSGVVSWVSGRLRPPTVQPDAKRSRLSTPDNSASCQTTEVGEVQLNELNSAAQTSATVRRRASDSGVCTGQVYDFRAEMPPPVQQWTRRSYPEMVSQPVPPNSPVQFDNKSLSLADDRAPVPIHRGDLPTMNRYYTGEEVYVQPPS